VVAAIGLDRLLALLDTRTHARIERLGRLEDRSLRAAAHVLLRSILAQSLNVAPGRIRIATTPYGKPYVPNVRDFHFNLAHAGDWAVCATDTRPIGVDVEAVRPLELEAAEHMLSREEYRDLLRQQRPKRLRQFYELWTLKESYVKALGVGFRIAPQSFTLRIQGRGAIALSGPNAVSGYHFQQYDIAQNHLVAVCATHAAFPRHIRYVGASALWEFARRALS
jgi:4'-phosphopantetheinyl transferase